MLIQVIPQYILWHYTLGLRSTAAFGTNLLRFLFAFFSLSLLIRTLFSPWRRLGEDYTKGLRPGAWFETFVINTLMRLVGFLIRLGLIFAGVVTLLLGVILFLSLVIGWLLAPVIIISLAVAGLFLIIT